MRTWLIDLRIKHEYTQMQISNIVGISRAYYTMIENNDRNPSVAIAKKIANVLDCDWTLFFEQNSNVMLP